MDTTKPIKLAYKVIEPFEKKGKNDIIMLHGLGGCKENFDDILNNLVVKTGRRIYALDARNHGDTEWSDVFTIEAMTSDVINFMIEHNINSAVLLGHSMGGRLAMNIALNHPDRVEKLIVEDMTPKAIPNNVMKGYIELMKVLYHSIDTIQPGTDYIKVLLIIFEYVSKNKPEGVLLNAKIIKGKTRSVPLIEKDGKYVWKANFPVIIKETVNLGFSDNLEGVFNKPVLIAYGTLSELNVRNDESFIVNLFPQALFYGLIASHNVHYECSEEFVQSVTSFLQ